MANFGSVLIPEEINILVSSALEAGAVNKSVAGSSFSVQLDEPIQVPADALNVSLSVDEATVWWTVPNILTGVNDRMYITGLDTFDAVQNYIITIPQGLYDLSGINQSMLRELENAGAKIDPSPLLSLSPDEATQRVEIRFNYPTTVLDFTPIDTPRDILGFNSQVLGAYPGAPVSILADNVANFNIINYFLIHCDLVSRGIRFNNLYNQTISQVLIDNAPGSQLVSKPFNPARIDANELAGVRRNLFRVWLTDDADRLVNTNSEDFTFRMVIRYLRPTIIKQV